MTAHDLTLNEVIKSAKVTERTHRVSDFLSKEQKIDISRARELKALEGVRGFDEVDAYSAEILARFGWQAWQAWQCGQIKTGQMSRYVMAERARAKREIISLEALIVAVGAGANNPTKSGKAPKSLRNAVKIFQSEQKQAKGVR